MIHDDMPSKRIGLALSGGGFRATLFHLGVVRLLYDAGVLTNVRHITAVSGGSILAAHLGVNWSRYTGSQEDFEAAASELIGFTRSDVRGNIIRRWILSWLLVLPGLCSILPRIPQWLHWTRASVQLQRSYAALFKKKTLESLPAVPNINILSTSMTTGSPWSFTRNGVAYEVGDQQRHITTTTLELSYAVAASSAFPPMFPPIGIDHKILSCNAADFPTKQYLTDGGVHDNLGIEALIRLWERQNDLDLLLVSDAEGNFDWSVNRSYRFFIVNRTRFPWTPV